MRTRKRRKTNVNGVGLEDEQVGASSRNIDDPCSMSVLANHYLSHSELKHSACQQQTKHKQQISYRSANSLNYNNQFYIEPICKQRSKHKTIIGLPQVIVVTILCLLYFYDYKHSSTDRHSYYLNLPFLIKPVACQRLSRFPQQSTPVQNPFQLQNNPPQITATSNTNLIRPQQVHNNNNHIPELILQQGGLIKNKNVTFTKQYNPILITKDIVIQRNAKLIIEAGSEVLFEKRKGIIVYGTLEILGQPNDWVKLNLLRTHQSATVNFRSQNNNPIGQQQIRLVDGDLPNEGRVQIKFNDRWHSLCTNSKNLTAADIRVICQQVGYQDGSWYKWFPRKNDTILQIMSKSFQCTGSEIAISQCKRWNRVRTGGGVCDYHSDIGIRCLKTFSPTNGATYEYWRGIEFMNGETTHEYVLGGQMKQGVSRSSLNHVTISDSGLNEVGNATAAIRVLGQPPKMSHIEVKNSIYGIMIEEVDDAIHMNNIRLINNMAAPLFINTSWGAITMDHMHVENNGGDGIRIIRHEKILTGTHDFCKFANLGTAQSYPVILSHEQTFFNSGQECCQEFMSANQLTVHFPVLRSTPNNLLPEGDSSKRISIPPGVSIGKDASLVIYDDYRDEYPFTLRIQNGTRAQSVVSKAGRLKICYEPAAYRTVLFTIAIVANNDATTKTINLEDDSNADDEQEDLVDVNEWTGMARDVEISNSLIKGNEGRGLWIENQRSGVKLQNTTIILHNYLSGLHVENGTGEVIIEDSTISNNTGHGVFINLAGGFYHVDNSTISDNSLKGIHIEYDRRPELVPFNSTVHVGYTLFARNGENGLFLGNVCRSDAFWNISMNSFISNGEDAIFFQSCFPSHESVIAFKNLAFRLNRSDPDLLFHNNYQEMHVTHNVFVANQRRALSMAPVFFVKSFIRHNLFKEHSLAVLHIGNQVLPDAESYNCSQAAVNIRIASNRFYSNKGRYVASIGLQEDNARHSLMFTKNTLEDNTITEPYAELRPRSRVSAVVVVSSSNCKVIRNRFDNPLSTFELGSHLEMHSKIINATLNFWGPGLDAANVYKRIFDRKNRYNLAQVEFLQYLLSPEDLEYATDLSFDRERDKISTFKNGTRLGGEIKGYEELTPGTYIVQDDLFVRPGAHLILKPGTVLKFHDGVGMMVQGRIDAIGQPNSQIVFTSTVAANRMPQRASITTTTTPSPMANSWVSDQINGENEFENYERYPNQSSSRYQSRGRYSRIKRQLLVINQNVRLSHTTMGRLEVQIDGVWGSVCDYNFDINDAAVVCQQLGMILNKDDWLLEKFQYAANDRQQISMMSTNVLMTNLRCDPALDTDITKCKAEISLRGDFDGMCNSEVGIRCFPPSWSGIRLGMGAEISTLEHLTIQKAGMFDYATYSMRPALQVDLNRHLISSLIVRSNSDSGLGIMWNDVIGRHFFELSLNDCKFHNNERHGIELRSKGLSIRNSLLSNNRQNGLDYNPSFTQRELTDLVSWLYTPKNSDNIVHLQFSQQSRHFTVPSSEDSFRYFIIRRNPPADLKETFTISTDPGHMLSIHLLSPNHPESTENLNMSLGNSPESPIWDLSLNTTSFPMISPGYKFYFNYTSGRRPRGNIVLYVRSRYNNRDLRLLTKYVPSYLVMNKFDQTAININNKLLNCLSITNSNITKNSIGLRFWHPNFSYDNLSDNYQLRYSNETTNVTNNMFDGNHFSSIFVASGTDRDYHYQQQTNWPLDNSHQVPASEINYHVLGNKFRRNRDGIRQFGRDIRNSNNAFHWSINDTLFEFNRGGGINILLPYFWRYDTNLSHTIEMNNNSFYKNNQFEMSIDGHFVKFNLTSNIFRENRCKNGLLSLGGMEKKMLIRNNAIEQNTCNRIFDMNIQSHADKMGHVTAQFEFNSLRYNRKVLTNATYSSSSLVSTFRSNPKLLTRLHPQAMDYTMSLRGLQAINITRNLFVNPELRFELVIGILLDPNERTVNAIENYWGSVLQSDIDERVFDFDDWNSFSVAELSPYLTQESFVAATIIGGSRAGPFYLPQHQQQQLVGLTPLGGRLTQSMHLSYRKEPYIIESDFTIMPGVRLVIEKGVVLEFMPNVGILVLGDLIASGTREQPVQMRPVLSASEALPLYQYLHHLSSSKLKASNIITHNNDNFLLMNDPLAYEYNYALRHNQLAYPIDMGSLRLCKNEICNDGAHIYENNIEDPTLRQEVLKSSNNTWKMDGFLEIFNMTTLQWVPVCDPLFTEHNARVVCRQLGYTHLSLLKRGRRYTIEYELISSIRNWPESVQCEGDESSLANCPLAYGFINHTTSCSRESNQFIYVYCSDFPDTTSSLQQYHGQSDEQVHHWGGIRFSCPLNSVASSQQQQSDRYNSADLQASGDQLVAESNRKSRLQYVNIDRAGMLHRKKSPALQVLQCNVPIEYVSVSNSAHHGLEVITSQGNQNYHQLRLRNNLGIGLNYLTLTGSSSASRLVPYLPLKHLDISSDIFGLVDICGANKEIQVEERLLLFYRYSSQAVDCVKIVSSKLDIKHIGIRMLQFDLFNSTPYTTRPDSLKVYDGNIFDRDSRLLVEFGVTERHRIERPELKFYQTSDSTMTIRLHVSGASSYFGFIAELVTTPVSYNIQRDTYNNVTFSEFTGNKLGAFNVASAGESSPNLIIRNNRFESNCLHLFGNFTSCSSAIYMELQNCQRLRVINNLLKHNQGGLMIKSYSHSAVSALDASIESNVFEANRNTNILALLGPKQDPYQTVRVKRNIFTRNVAQFLSNIVLSRIVSNFSHNIVSGNLGKHQIEVIGFDKLPLSYQAFSSNWIYNNTATYERDKSTISGNSAGQQYIMNYLVNPDNHFEISTMNWSRFDVKPFHVPKDDEIIHLISGDGSSKDVFRKTADAIPISIVDTKRNDLYHATISAQQNWWGFNSSAAVQGRIRDRVQHEELLKVDYLPYLASNKSVLSGVCAGGWQKVGESCLLYLSSRMTYQEARDFCDRERATLPLLRANHHEISDFVRSQEAARDFDPRIDRVWLRSFEVSREACPALNDYRTKNYDCQDKYSFMCEKDPQIIVSMLYWHRETGGLIALVLALVTIVLTTCCTLCWAYKSRQRHKEKLDRKSSIYASMRSNRGLGLGAGSTSQNNSLSELFLHRQLYQPANGGQVMGEKSSITDVSLSSTLMTQPSDLLPAQNSIRLDPGYSSANNDPKNYQLYQAQQGRSSADQVVGYANSRSSTRSFYEREPQPSLNPAYVSPSPLSGSSRQQQRISPRIQTNDQTDTADRFRPTSSYSQQQMNYQLQQQFYKPMVPTPTPSVNQQQQQQQQQRATSGSQLNGSRTPSYTGSFTGNPQTMVSTEPMPAPHAPVAPAYSRIDHRATGGGGQRTPEPPQYQYSNYVNNYRPTYGNLPSMDPAYNNNNNNGIRNGNQVRNIDESTDSSVPTYYSNHFDLAAAVNQLNTEESTTTTQSYLEGYNGVYNKTLQSFNDDHETSYTIHTEERSSIADFIMNSTSQLNSQLSAASSNNLSMPQKLTSSMHKSVDDYLGANFSTMDMNQRQLQPQQQPQYKAFSEAAAPTQMVNPRGYLVETSFDQESSPINYRAQDAIDMSPMPTGASSQHQLQQQQMPMQTTATISMFGSSQRLSPVSSLSLSYAAPDSKLGSRVYLETSFE